MTKTSCKINTPLNLTINEDKTATFESTATNIVDYYNCVPGGIIETYTAVGIVNEDEEIAMFDSCNDNGYLASGTIVYKDGKLSGEVACINKKGGYTEVIFTVGK